MSSESRGRAASLVIAAMLAVAAWVGGSVVDARTRTLTCVPLEGDVVALTFDDGPDPRYTPEILAILRSNGVPATFFVVGRKVEACRERLDYRGHLVGFHTYSHKDGLRATARAQIADFKRGMAAVPATWPTEPPCFRSPFGRTWPATVRWADRHGTYMDWNVCYDALIHDKHDPGRVLPHEQRIAAVLSKIRPGSIVLFHDAEGNARYLVEDLPAIIRALKSRGYRFVTPREFAVCR